MSKIYDIEDINDLHTRQVAIDEARKFVRRMVGVVAGVVDKTDHEASGRTIFAVEIAQQNEKLKSGGQALFAYSIEIERDGEWHIRRSRVGDGDSWAVKIDDLQPRLVLLAKTSLPKLFTTASNLVKGFDVKLAGYTPSESELTS